MMKVDMMKADDSAAKLPPRSVVFKGEPLTVPDAFWDAEADCPNVGALVKSHTDLRQKISERGNEDVSIVVPDAYELAVPEALVGRVAVDVDDPLAKGAMDWARKNGLGQEAFSELAALYYSKLSEGLNDADRNMEGEMQKLHDALGPQADRDMDDLTRWVDGLLGEDLANAPELYLALDHLTSTADGVVLLKTLKERLGERGVPTSRSGGLLQLNEEALRELQASEAYKSGDVATRRKVSEGWARLYPEQNA